MLETMFWTILYIKDHRLQSQFRDILDILRNTCLIIVNYDKIKERTQSALELPIYLFRLSLCAGKTDNQWLYHYFHIAQNPSFSSQAISTMVGITDREQIIPSDSTN